MRKEGRKGLIFVTISENVPAHTVFQGFLNDPHQVACFGTCEELLLYQVVSESHLQTLKLSQEC